MFFSGIADEAGASIDVQIQAHQELLWNHIELRNIDGENATAMADEKFDAMCGKLEAAGMRVSCFASAIANWARPIKGDFQVDVADLKRAIPRMHKLQTPYIRVMSYPNDKDAPLPEPQWRQECIRRMKELARIAEDGGVILGHENCSGWGGVSPETHLDMLAEVDSPALKVLYDTGNPVGYGQDPWDYYTKVRDHIVYVHIKDGNRDPEGKAAYTYAGQGEGCVPQVIKDLYERGYTGGLSIEPHLAAIIHTGEQSNRAERLYSTYTEYGRRLMQLVRDIREDLML